MHVIKATEINFTWHADWQHFFNPFTSVKMFHVVSFKTLSRLKNVRQIILAFIRESGRFKSWVWKEMGIAWMNNYNVVWVWGDTIALTSLFTEKGMREYLGDIKGWKDNRDSYPTDGLRLVQVHVAKSNWRSKRICEVVSIFLKRQEYQYDALQ